MTKEEEFEEGLHKHYQNLLYAKYSKEQLENMTNAEIEAACNWVEETLIKWAKPILRKRKLERLNTL